MSHRVQLRARAWEQLGKLPSAEQEVLLSAIEALENAPQPPAQPPGQSPVQPPSGQELQEGEVCQVRVGRFRILYQVQDEGLVVEDVLADRARWPILRWPIREMPETSTSREPQAGSAVHSKEGSHGAAIVCAGMLLFLTCDTLFTCYGGGSCGTPCASSIPVFLVAPVLLFLPFCKLLFAKSLSPDGLFARGAVTASGLVWLLVLLSPFVLSRMSY